jgi:hypothetical protein
VERGRSVHQEVKRKFYCFGAIAVLAISALCNAKDVPTGFVRQTLEPGIGEINKPRGWIYSHEFVEENGGMRLMWTLSKERFRDGSYDTGFRLQVFLGIQKATGKTAKQFIDDFISAKRKEAKEVPRDCRATKQGEFTRICLETEEGKYRILYSFLWQEGGDTAVIAISGAKKSEWQKFSATFNQMNGFTLIDPNELDRILVKKMK